MNHYVYQIRDKKTNQFYIGSRSCECEPEEDSYMGSPCTWEPNEENLEKHILFKGFSNRDIAFAVERATIKEFIDQDLNENYHIPSEGFHTLGKTLSEEHKEKLIKNHADFTKENHPMWGKSHTKKSKRKMSKNSIGYFPSKETRELLSKLRTGKHNPFYGKSHTKKSKRKMSISAKNRNITPEMEKKRRNKISKSLSGSNSPLSKKVKHLPTGKIYNTMSIASQKVGISISCISLHCNGKRDNIKWEFV